MSAVRDELRHLVDDLPDDQVESVLEIVRSRIYPLGRRERALATLTRVRERMQGVTGVDEEVDQLRDNPRA